MTSSAESPPHTLSAMVQAEIERARAAGDIQDTVSKCPVCCEDESKRLVNSLLGAGLTNREITECCEAINTRRRANDDQRLISAYCVWKHRQHLGFDAAAAAVYREILERRAQEDNQDYVNGIGHAITAYAVLETVMVKGYRGLTAEDEDAPTPTIGETMKAAKDLHEMTKSDAGQRRMADLLYQMDRIVNAAQEFVPAHLQDAFLARVQGRDTAGLRVLSERAHETAREAIREFSPSTKVDEDDEL